MVRTASRRAVLFVDIAGSGRLYRRLGDVHAQRVVGEALELLVDTLPEHGGRMVKTLGDCVLCVFPEPDSAVVAARRMQQILDDSEPGGEAVRIHAGVDFGPVIEDNGDVFGDTVNVAAYLSAMASADQILITERMVGALSPAEKAGVRPVFDALLKGSVSSTAVYEVLWKPETAISTVINPRARRLLPSDLGSLRVVSGSNSFVVNRLRPGLAIGRGADNDLVVNDLYASHRHATIVLRRTNFYLEDQSINGTFVRFQNGAEVHVLREELLLGGPGRISVGRGFEELPGEAIDFFRDRRAMFRV